MNQSKSIHVFVALMVVYAALAGSNVFLPQGDIVSVPSAAAPAAPWAMALVATSVTLVAYGALGLLGLFLSHKLSIPHILDARVTNRQRIVIPAISGAVIGLFVIVCDLAFAPINGIGHIPHPPFPTSLVAALAAGIGEETLFRLFFISLWTWLVSKVLLRGRFELPVYGFVAVISAIAVSLAHLPAVMYLEGWSAASQVPSALIAELILMNGTLGLVSAYLFRKYGFLASVGVHFWADVVWHVIWGLL